MTTKRRFVPPMPYDSVIAQVTALSGLPEPEVRRILSILVQVMVAAMKDGFRVEIDGLGKFQLKAWKERLYKTPQGHTGVIKPFRQIYVCGEKY